MQESVPSLNVLMSNVTSKVFFEVTKEGDFGADLVESEEKMNLKID